jgi:hypothetical protein
MLPSVLHVDLCCQYVRAASSRVNNTVSGRHLPRTFTLLKTPSFFITYKYIVSASQRTPCTLQRLVGECCSSFDLFIHSFIHSFRSPSSDRSVASAQRVLHTVRTNASSFIFQYLLHFLRSSSISLRLLYLLPVTSVLSFLQ